MAWIVLERSGDSQLVLTDAEEIAAGDSRHARGREANRWHEVGIYRRTDGSYAISIAYRTQWEGELDRHWVEMAAGPAEVRAALRAVNPCGELLGYPPGPAYQEKRTRLEADLRQRWEALVSEVLSAGLFAERLA